MHSISSVWYLSHLSLLLRSWWLTSQLGIVTWSCMYSWFLTSLLPSLYWYSHRITYILTSQWSIWKKETRTGWLIRDDDSNRPRSPDQRFHISESIPFLSWLHPPKYYSHPVYPLVIIRTKGLQSLFRDHNHRALLLWLLAHCSHLQILSKLEDILHYYFNWIRLCSHKLHLYYSWITSFLYCRTRLLLS